MQFKDYKQERTNNLPPNLDAGTVLQKIVRFEENTFKLNNEDVKGMRVFAIDATGKEKEYRTSSGVIMSQIVEFAKAHPTDVMENVKVIAPRGKKYLSLEEA